MSERFHGGCDHVKTHTDANPVDNHICHCSVCRSVTGQKHGTHVVFFKYEDLVVDNIDNLNRQPFNVNNPDGPLELCTCKTCGAPIMLDDKEHRIRAIVPNLMGYDEGDLPATYHAFYDPAHGEHKPDDGRPVYAAFRPDFVMPEPCR